MSAGRRRFPAPRRTAALNRGDWKVPPTGSLERLPYSSGALDTPRHRGQIAEALPRTWETLFAA